MVYFLRFNSTRLIKIGRTLRLAVRVRQLAFEFGEEPDVLGIVSEERFSEVSLHRLFKRLRSHREFFAPDPILLHFIRDNATAWHPSLDAEGGYSSIRIDRHVRWQLKAVAEAKGISLESLIDQLLRGQAARLHAEIRREEVRF